MEEDFNNLPIHFYRAAVKLIRNSDAKVRVMFAGAKRNPDCDLPSFLFDKQGKLFASNFFNGIQPFFLNNENVSLEGSYIRIARSYILDSNVCSEVLRCIDSPMDGSSEIRELLFHVLRHRQDLNPMWYLIESCYNSEDHIETYIKPTYAAIKRLQLARFDMFVEHSQIVIDDNILSKELATKNTNCFFRMVDQDVRNFLKVSKEFDSEFKLNYCCLLKVKCIDLKFSTFKSKMKELAHFLVDGIGKVNVYVWILAIAYYKGKVRRVLRVESDTKPEEALNRLSSAARDMSLVKLCLMHSLMIDDGNMYLTDLVTRDFGLKLFSDLIRFGMTYRIEDRIFTMPLSEYPEYLTENEVTFLNETKEEMEEGSANRILMPLLQLDPVIRQLEGELLENLLLNRARK